VYRNIAKGFHLLAVLVVLGAPVSLPLQASIAHRDGRTSESTNAFNWQSPAKLHRRFKTATGTLIFNSSGIEFHSDDPRTSHAWPYLEVKTFDLTSRSLVITDYENHGHHLPGERRFRFELNNSIPASVAAELAQRVNKPVQNGDPDAAAPVYFTVPARHGTSFGGTNGTLRFRDDGIDYVTSGGQDSRSWRWADIQTLANPTPYQLRVGGYLETFEFELKEPMSASVFDHLWDHVYARDLNVEHTPGGQRHAE
jgi:hypothetical protein